jgi:alkylated DNA repair dioxygenase AlkB
MICIGAPPVIQETLFEGSKKAPAFVPPGFRYQPDVITPEEEQTLVEEINRLALKPFEFHGYVGNRRTASFGLRYDYTRRMVDVADEPPAFLKNLREKIAIFAGRQPEDFHQIGINEYSPGAGIGWHRDKPEFGDIVGVSLLATVKMRFRKRQGAGWARANHALEGRSGYVLTGDARHVWQHSIPPVASLRYSVTFRTLAPKGV